MKGRITKLGAIALATAIGFATVATLVKAADPITDRREAMKGNGAAMKAINEVAEERRRGRRPGEARQPSSTTRR